MGQHNDTNLLIIRTDGHFVHKSMLGRMGQGLIFGIPIVIQGNTDGKTTA